ncbi:hypothetical protein QGM67_19285 [Vibrio cholerae]|uniref:hypothetical protein n=1 Tax=Vibrio cholerae TaxID=666 RepID=UPI002478F23B|nr:hypothetical protein [Vibrio cholerae]MDH7616841.1 hypothetical protein [Vibrio cholerae]
MEAVVIIVGIIIALTIIGGVINGLMTLLFSKESRLKIDIAISWIALFGFLAVGAWIGSHWELKGILIGLAIGGLIGGGMVKESYEEK